MMKCQLSAVALVVSLVAHPILRSDPLPELCTEQAEGQFRRIEEAMHLPPALTPNDIAARKQIKESLITTCVTAALHKEGTQ